MARVVVTGFGTAGDFVPLVALAEELRHRGHAVLAAVNAWAAPLFRNTGVDAAEVGAPFGPAEAASHVGLFDSRARWTAEQSARAADLVDVPRQYRDLVRSCRAHRAQVLVAGVASEAARWVSEDLRVPWVQVHTSCVDLAHATTEGVPAEAHPPLTLVLADPIWNPGERTYTGTWHGAAWPDPLRQTGWGEPSRELRTFLGAVGREGAMRPRRWRDGPLVLLPGSTPLPDPIATLRVHVDAAAALGRRLVVQSGWAGMSRARAGLECRSDHVLVMEELPQAWLLARAAAAIVSGRPGTLHRAVRAGCPVLVEPWGRDAFAYAAGVLRLGVGAVLDPRLATAGTVGRILSERLMHGGVRRRCARVARRMAGPNGAEAACDAMEAWLAREQSPAGCFPRGVLEPADEDRLSASR